MLRIAAKTSENLLEQEESGFTIPEAEPLENESVPESPSRFFDQLIVTVICLILLLLGLKNGHPRVQWVREQLHHAFNASTEATFGVLGHSPALQSLLRTGQNLVKLEEITQPLWRERNGTETVNPASLNSNTSLPGAVWPAAGSVSRSFGWQYNPKSHVREFNAGIEIAASPGAAVQSLYSGEIVEIARQSGRGWQITVDHHTGWISVYRNLDQIKVQIGQKVTAGTIMGVLNPSPAGGVPAGGSSLWFEVKHEGQPIDPLSLFPA